MYILDSQSFGRALCQTNALSSENHHFPYQL
jgi:hypothetical protein